MNLRTILIFRPACRALGVTHSTAVASQRIEAAKYETVESVPEADEPGVMDAARRIAVVKAAAVVAPGVMAAARRIAVVRAAAVVAPGVMAAARRIAVVKAAAVVAPGVIDAAIRIAVVKAPATVAPGVMDAASSAAAEDGLKQAIAEPGPSPFVTVQVGFMADVSASTTEAIAPPV